MTLTVASLCSGYGGLELALELWLGRDAVDVAWHAEVNDHASLVLKTRRPDVPNLGDFTTPDFWASVPRADLHAGGVPCQPFSAAGRRAGTDDARHLWPFWLGGIRDHRPATVVFENVQGLARGKMKPVFEQIIADLVALGYDVRWCLIGACAVGAAHHRHRVFLLACRTRGTPHARQVIVQTCGQHEAAYLPTPVATLRRTTRYAATHPREKSQPGLEQALEIGRGEVPREVEGCSPAELGPGWHMGAKDNHRDGRDVSLLPTPVREDARRGVVADGGAGRAWQVGRASSGMLGTEVVNMLRTPSARDGGVRGQGSVEHMERRIESGHTINLGDQLVLLPSPRGSDDSNGGPSQGIASGDVALSSAVIGERFGKYAAAVERHAGVMGVMPPEPTEIGPKGGRRLAAAFSEWLMMLPAGYVTDILDRSPALERCGNGVVPLQAATALRLLFADLTK